MSIERLYTGHGCGSVYCIDYGTEHIRGLGSCPSLSSSLYVLRRRRHRTLIHSFFLNGVYISLSFAVRLHIRRVREKRALLPLPIILLQTASEWALSSCLVLQSAFAVHAPRVPVMENSAMRFSGPTFLLSRYIKLRGLIAADITVRLSVHTPPASPKIGARWWISDVSTK